MRGGQCGGGRVDGDGVAFELPFLKLFGDVATCRANLALADEVDVEVQKHPLEAVGQNRGVSIYILLQAHRIGRRKTRRRCLPTGAVGVV